MECSRYVAGKCFWFFIPLYWLTNNNEKNEKKNLKRCKGYDKRRTDVQRGTAAEGNG